MDIETLYFKSLSTTFACITVLLFPLCILMCFIDSPRTTETFPPPSQTEFAKSQEPKEVTVPLFPTLRELFPLLAALLVHMVLLCPYLPSETTKPMFSQYWGFPLFAYHGLRAICLAGVETNWVAAQERQGLWHLKFWKLYYSLQIFMGVAVGLPLLFRLAAYIAVAVYHVVPIVYWALRTAYAPLNWDGGEM
jgi:hypothetical protein